MACLSHESPSLNLIIVVVDSWFRVSSNLTSTSYTRIRVESRSVFLYKEGPKNRAKKPACKMGTDREIPKRKLLECFCSFSCALKKAWFADWPSFDVKIHHKQVLSRTLRMWACWWVLVCVFRLRLYADGHASARRRLERTTRAARARAGFEEILINQLGHDERPADETHIRYPNLLSTHSSISNIW